MQQFNNTYNLYFHIMKIAKSKLDRNSFCKIHSISNSKLYRILNNKQECSLELFNYIIMELGLKISIILE